MERDPERYSAGTIMIRNHPSADDFKTRIQWHPEDAIIRVDGRRKILVDVDAMHALRETIVNTVGQERARGIYRRFGYGCGKADFEQAAATNPEAAPEDLLALGLQAHMFMGHVHAELTKTRLDMARKDLRAEGVWRHSFETDCILPLGPSSCWMLQGYASGWASALVGKPVVALERQCTGAGAPFCIFELRTPEKPFGPEQVFLDDLGQVNLEDHIGLLEQLAADLRMAQNRLMGSEAKYRALFENAPDMMMLCDPVTGRILDVNRAVVERLGYERDAVLRMTLRDLHPQKDHATLSKVIGPSITDPVGSSPMQLVGSAKQVCSVEAAFSLVPFAGSTVLQAIYHDVTGFQTAQMALREAEELARIGRMASAVAHEIRNPLSAIVSGIRLLTSSKRSEEERALIFDTILAESERLDSTLNDFLQFARPRNPRRKPENLEGMLLDLVRIIWSDKDAVGSVVPKITVSPDLPLVNCDGDQIRQVFWNVILNAIQAMAGQGELAVDVTHENGLVRVSIADTGPGIPPEELERVFEPFHTTKPRGTGLGLPIARRIIQAHGGAIVVKSQPGTGTRVTFTLTSEGIDGNSQSSARR